MDALLKFIRSLTSFSDESWTLLQPALTKKNFKKNEYLLKEGQVCRSLYFIEKGYCKSYYTINGVVKNTGFFFEGDIATNISSFGSDRPSEYFMTACEPLSVTQFDKQLLMEAGKRSPEIETVGRHCIRLFAARQETFATLFKLYMAAERLRYLEENYPFMLQRIPLLQLAPFLGVARETLSRIRNRRSQ
ncbi:Crp/Fnr family transcriptional regulator [Niabella ginsenosidivorans]|uniref:Crp/Fnr family transcriptional regulator n=1 Tax=Niabella ginsenosidivorans TaxID=1176587 RepID=A0A1A9I7D8_9BACT|nr:Crp/Fnr family transcriptional regulator [Niabella ginsenosidivorans]ANH82620.1 Crp/Fnr family transcriptional regulator [Niabella ginsenosidivorans]